MAVNCRQSRLFLDYLRYGKNVQRSCSSIAIEQGLQAALNHSRPSPVLIKQRPLISPQHGQVFIGFSFMSSGVKNCRDKPSGGECGSNAQDNSRSFAPSENRDHCDECHCGNDENGRLHWIIRLKVSKDTGMRWFFETNEKTCHPPRIRKLILERDSMAF